MGEAVVAGHTDVVRNLLAQGANPNSMYSFTHPRFNGGREYRGSVLVTAIVFRHPEVAHVLLEKGIDFDNTANAFAICPAVNTRQPEIVAALIKAGIEVNPRFKCIRNYSPIQSALRRRYHEISDMLLKAGAKP